MTAEMTADDPQALKTITVSKILNESGFDEIDLLKIEIELRGENLIFMHET